MLLLLCVWGEDGLHEQDPMQGASVKNQVVGLLQAVQYLKGERHPLLRGTCACVRSCCSSCCCCLPLWDAESSLIVAARSSADRGERAGHSRGDPVRRLTNAARQCFVLVIASILSLALFFSGRFLFGLLFPLLSLPFCSSYASPSSAVVVPHVANLITRHCFANVRAPAHLLS